MVSGEDYAWELLNDYSAKEICRKADVQFEHSTSSYVCESYGQQVYVSLKEKRISGNSETGNFLTNDLGHFYRLSILRYLIQAKEIVPSGNLVKLNKFPGGDAFVRGSHTLPLDKIAEAFSNNPEGFFNAGNKLAGYEQSYGDFSLQLLPFPRVPVVLIVWKGDEEFPADCSLLFDSTCDFHLPTDIIWATAFVSIKLMLLHDNSTSKQ